MTNIKTFATMPTLPSPAPAAIPVPRPDLAVFGAPVANSARHASGFGGLQERPMPRPNMTATPISAPISPPKPHQAAPRHTVTAPAPTAKRAGRTRSMKLSLHEGIILLTRDIPRVREIVGKQRVYPEGSLLQGISLCKFISSPEMITLLETAAKSKIREIALPDPLPVNPIARTAYILSAIVDSLTERGTSRLDHAAYVIEGESEFATQLRIEDTLAGMLETLAPNDNIYALMPARG